LRSRGGGTRADGHRDGLLSTVGGRGRSSGSSTLSWGRVAALGRGWVATLSGRWVAALGWRRVASLSRRGVTALSRWWVASLGRGWVTPRSRRRGASRRLAGTELLRGSQDIAGLGAASGNDARGGGLLDLLLVGGLALAGVVGGAAVGALCGGIVDAGDLWVEG
jgi:hypothetical protein